MNLDQRSRIIGVFLIKLAVRARRQEFRQRIEKLAFQFIEDISVQNFRSSLRTIAALDGLIHFGKVIYEIEPVNAEHIKSEILGLKNEIIKIAELELPNSGRIQLPFDSKKEISALGQLEQKEEKIKESKLEKKEQTLKTENNPSPIISSNIESQNIENPKQQNGLDSTDVNVSTRHEALQEKIRQFGNRQFQLKDIIAAFPDVSERTLRYDLQRFCNQGIIERIGSGGPGTHYKMRII